MEIEGCTSSIGTQHTGIRQGCPLSPYLFILLMDRLFATLPKITHDLREELKLPHKHMDGLNTTFQALLHADDTALHETHEDNMETLLWSIEKSQMYLV